MSTELTRENALILLKKLENQDLRLLAGSYGITVFDQAGKFNKGWAGQTIERCLGLAANSRREPDFGDWELKVIPLVKNNTGKFWPKETMAITMLSPTAVSTQTFLESHLYNKLRKMIVVGRSFVNRSETSSTVIQAETFDFDDHTDKQLIIQIKEDYEEIQRVLNSANTLAEGFAKLSGKLGVCVQPRTKGAGHGSISRAFYMRKEPLAKLLKLI